MIPSIFLTREAVIALGVAAVVLAIVGSWLRIKYKEEKRKLASVFNYVGYGLLGLSILMYIILGFKWGRM